MAVVLLSGKVLHSGHDRGDCLAELASSIESVRRGPCWSRSFVSRNRGARTRFSLRASITRSACRSGTMFCASRPDGTPFLCTDVKPDSLVEMAKRIRTGKPNNGEGYARCSQIGETGSPQIKDARLCGGLLLWRPHLPNLECLAFGIGEHLTETVGGERHGQLLELHPNKQFRGK